ncbi:hypothetical protein EI427_01950 [Flammeovirga pectinis]|uniref:Uncharacterized protein n=1 Tax=Flammeovirga pectinis TaxID=2494373 RepID=A0A3S9NYI6_9BACT|nr:hypothetical protein [Flammeovirga pectinis]AZQ61023.1 hypothetical protein EI427_01950 [Flammeovirga pectinis]
MTKTKILTILMVPVVLILAWALYHSVFDTIRESKEIKKSEAVVTKQLKMIREAETAYLSRYKKYTASWDTLAMFIDDDTIYNVQKKEIITPRTKNDPLYYTRTDSVRIEYDTIGATQVRERIFPGQNFDAKKLKYISGKNGKEFELSVDKKKKGNANIAFIEVVDRFPRDPQRKESNASPTRRLLKFGSLFEATTAGNWE